MGRSGGRRGRTRMLTIRAVVLVIGLPLFALVPQTAAQAAPAWHAWAGTPTYVFRDGTYDKGEFIYSNGIFQSQGANSDLLHRADYYAASGQLAPLYSPPNDIYRALTYDFFGAHRATHNGDYQLPTDRTLYPDFTTDLAELRLAATSTDLFVRMEFTSFPRPDAQIATLTFATQGAGVASSAWPRNAGVKSSWSTALTLWGTGAALNTASTNRALGTVGGSFRTSSHVFEARVPLADLPPGPWTLTGGSGLNDTAAPGNYLTVPAGLATATKPGSGFVTAPGANVWDLLFARDATWTFDEKKQADDLLGGNVTSDNQVVALSALQAGATNPAPARTGDLSRYFVSRVNSGDGINRSAGLVPFSPPAGFVPPLPTTDFDTTFSYLGGLQPYYMHVPASYPSRAGPMPLIVYLHGFTGLPDEPFYNPIGLVATADQNGYLFASALGRGDLTYKGPGDVDVQEVIADVEKHYDVDPTRIYLMGHSMGGYGTNNVGIHHPDLFAAIAPAEGTDSIPLHQNLLNTPWFIMTADFDLDPMGQQANILYSDLSADGYDAALLQYHLKTHEYSSIYDTLPRLFRFFASHRLNPNPAVVSYSRLPGDDMPQIGLVYDHAYWVSGLRNADANLMSTVRVESFGIPHADLAPAQATRVSGSVDEGGPSGRTSAVLKYTTPAYGPQQTVANAASIDAANTSAMSLDLGRMQLRLDCALTLQVKTDHPLTVNLGAEHVSAPAGTSTQVVGSGVCSGTAAATTTSLLPNTSAADRQAPAGIVALIAGVLMLAIAGIGSAGLAKR